MLKRIIYSFPIQLVVEHLKVSQLSLACWLLVMLVVGGDFGKVLGIPYLFLDPEYLDQVNFLSFFIVGLSFGLMIVSFHITSYILFSSKYSFIGILSYPFSKFSINNSLIPLIVLLYYVIHVLFFQMNNEFSDLWHAVWLVFAFLAGTLSTIFLFYRYFHYTNKDIFKFLTGSVDKTLKKSKANRANALKRLDSVKKKSYHVESYLDLKLRVRSTAGLHDFYDKEAVLKVFDQNHLNSFIIDVFILGFIVIAGFFVDVRVFQIPAAATGMLLLSLAIMLLGAVSYWFRGWVVTTLTGVFLVLNLLVATGFLSSEHHAIGLDYDSGKKEYSLSSIEEEMTEDIKEDYKSTGIAVLNNWKKKQKTAKPKAVFLCVSGGGLRSALWTTNVLQALDRLTENQIMDQTVLITGASGGMIGAAYFRELAYQALNDTSINLQSHKILENIARDNLNPIMFSLFVNDMFIRFHKLNYEGRTYLKDRGVAFEKQLNINTQGVLDKKLSDYKALEEQARIPMLILAPTIANDGRKLYLSAQNVSYMTLRQPDDPMNSYIIDGVDFSSFFKDQKSHDLRFVSALRMNASFPYITPNITLPSEPGMLVMDAGVADNFGISDALRFIHSFKDWFEENTSGIVFLSIRDTKKLKEIEGQGNLSIIDRFSSPISSVYNNLANLQDINNDHRLRMFRDAYDGEVDCIRIEYDKEGLVNDDGETFKSQRASLSWHLTTLEKRSIIKNIKTKHNQAAINQFMTIMSFPIETDSTKDLSKVFSHPEHD